MFDSSWAASCFNQLVKLCFKYVKKQFFQISINLFLNLFFVSVDSNDDLELLYENLAQYPIYKRNIDKYRYFGGIGKRNFEYVNHLLKLN